MKGWKLRAHQRMYPLHNCSDNTNLSSISAGKVEAQTNKKNIKREENDDESTQSSRVLTSTTRHGKKIQLVQRFTM